MASSDIPRDNQGVAEKPIIRSDIETDRYWSAVVTEEPISDDLRESVRADLKKAWHFQRDYIFRGTTKRIWTTADVNMIRLKDTIGEVKFRTLYYMCNKPTAVYWLQSAQEHNVSGQRTLMPTIIFGAIYGEWLRCHDTEPNIEFHHFFANPVRITSTGPSNIREVLDAHSSLCAQASSLLKKAEDSADHDFKYYSLFPLYHAVLVMIDHVDVVQKNDEIASDGLVSLSKFAQRQTVLIARTGVEEGLSAPISFESLKSQSLPLGRSDVITQDIDVVRVSLAVAVQFIVSLEMREELAIPKSKDELPLDTSLTPYTYLRPCPRRSSSPEPVEKVIECKKSPEAFADALILAADKYGYDNIPDTWQSIRRIKAGRVGEGFCEFKPEPFARRWKP